MDAMDTTEQPQQAATDPQEPSGPPVDPPIAPSMEPPAESPPAPSVHSGREQRRQVHLRHLVDHFGNLVIDASAYLGRAKMSLRTLLALKTGNIVRLDREVGQRLDLRINGQPFGYVDVRIDDDLRRLQITRVGIES